MVRTGQVFYVSASGTVQYGPDAAAHLSGPGGIGPSGSSGWPAPGVRDIALAGRIGGGAGFFVGRGGQFVANLDGALMFIVNDNIFSDNSGAFTVTIQVEE